MDLRRGEVHELGGGAGSVEVVDPGPAPGIRIDKVRDLDRLSDWVRKLNYSRLVVHRGSERYEMSGPESISSFIKGLKVGRDLERGEAETA
jgi:hypothetical protein